MVLNNLFQLNLLGKGGWTRRSPNVPASLNYSVILYENTLTGLGLLQLRWDVRAI